MDPLSNKDWIKDLFLLECLEELYTSVEGKQLLGVNVVLTKEESNSILSNIVNRVAARRVLIFEKYKNPKKRFLWLARKYLELNEKFGAAIENNQLLYTFLNN